MLTSDGDEVDIIPRDNNFAGKRSLSNANVQNTNRMQRRFNIQPEVNKEQEYVSTPEENGINELEEEASWQAESEKQESIDMSELNFLE